MLQSATDSHSERCREDSAWAPLRIGVFRMFWLASLASSLGTWIHEVGAGWLMTTLDATPEMVAAVRTSMALPIVLLAIPAGTLADRFDKRRLLILTQVLLLAVTAILALLTATELITPWGLLAITFIIGLGMVIHVPTWQSSVPELVPREQISRAVALGSISFNLARGIGPAIGGLLIAGLGLWSTFAVNAMSFAVVIVVLLYWKRTPIESGYGRSFWGSTRQGLRYVILKPVMRHVMLGVALFVFPGSALWGLLPLIARQELQWGPTGFGALVALIGCGAVLGASQLHRIQKRFGPDRTIALAMISFAAGMMALSLTPGNGPIAFAMLAMGAGWMATLTTLNSTAQVTLPPKLRARGMGCYLTMMAGSMSLGALVWGQTASAIGLTLTLQASAGLMAVNALTSLRFSLDAEANG